MEANANIITTMGIISDEVWLVSMLFSLPYSSVGAYIRCCFSVGIPLEDDGNEGKG